MSDLVFYLVDVFAEEKFGGNQLAVITSAGILQGSQMQRIANEMHFSETSFVLRDEKREGGYDVRIFTPATELPFAGHPTLGTAYIIKHYLEGQDTGDVVLNLKVGQIRVTFEKSKGQEVLWMEQRPPAFGATFSPDDFSRVLQLDRSDIDDRYPVQEVSTGLPFIIAPLKTLDAVKRSKSELARLKELIGERDVGILVFAPHTYSRENDLNVRVFVELYGVAEDPATGSANGCLAGYLSRYRYFGGEKVDIRVEQGYEVGRPSILLLKAEGGGDAIKVRVGGKVIPIATGRLAL